MMLWAPYLLVAVAPHAGAWIETNPLRRTHKPKASPLTRGRGLKLYNTVCGILLPPSPLTRGRGLKQGVQSDAPYGVPVAPHAGAWIETASREQP